MNKIIKSVNWQWKNFSPQQSDWQNKTRKEFRKKNCVISVLYAWLKWKISRKIRQILQTLVQFSANPVAIWRDIFDGKKRCFSIWHDLNHRRKSFKEFWMKKSVKTLMPSFLATRVLSKSHHEATKKSKLSELEKTQAFFRPLTSHGLIFQHGHGHQRHWKWC